MVIGIKAIQFFKLVKLFYISNILMSFLFVQSNKGAYNSEIHELTGKPLNTVAGTVFKCRAKFRINLYGAEQKSEQA